MAFVNLLEAVYPVGAVYISTVNTSPSSLIGGTWTQITNAVLRAATSTGYIGSDTHKITSSEMPSHNHQIGSDTNPYAYTTSDGDTGSDLSDGAGAGEQYKYPRALGTETNSHAKNTQSTGGGKQCRLSSVLTTALFGTELRRFFGGDVNGIY